MAEQTDEVINFLFSYAPCTLLVQPFVYPLVASLHIVLLDVVLIDASHHSWTPPILLLLSPYVSLLSSLA